MRVAVVGGGIAGLAAARALVGAGCDVTLYEAGPRAGGHVYTVAADGHAIDMGFIVCNRARYPQFTRMLDELGVPTRETAMAFSVALGDDEWGSADLGAMFADRRKVASLDHWRFLVAVVRFLARARRDRARGDALLYAATLDDYVAARATSRELRDRFVVPLAAALWSLAPDRCGAFPALTFVEFLEQHGMLRTAFPATWTTIAGGSSRYVDALVARLAADGLTLALATRVVRIARDAGGVTIEAAPAPAASPSSPNLPSSSISPSSSSSSSSPSSSPSSSSSSSSPSSPSPWSSSSSISPSSLRVAREARYDRVVIATHADTALALLDPPTEAERAVLGAFRYSENTTVLHADRAFLPRHPRAHAAWNYVADPDTSRVAVTYSMTKLQGLPDRPYLVTLNPRRAPAHAFHTTTFHHPQLDRAALAAQPRLAGLGAAHRTYYAGAHFGWGFHEDGMTSGLAAAAAALADRHRPGEDVPR